MNSQVAIWALLAAALLAANLPFLTSRRFGVWPSDEGRKGLAWHMLELLLLYFLVGGLGKLLEQQAGQIAPQSWEFYAITACVFLTFAFPGFVWRFLLKHSA